MDISLIYMGGSGGFLALHLILLSGSYNCKFFGENQDFEKIFQRQWNIENVSTWKKTETWPDNQQTLLDKEINNKIYFYCSPFDKDFNSYPGKKLIVYTDIETQYTLAKLKNAYWFYNSFIQSLQESEFKEAYKNVKSELWPECNSRSEFYNLSKAIQDECILKFDFAKLFDERLYKIPFIKKNSIDYKNELVDKNLKFIIEQADYVVKLQDIIKTKGLCLYSQLGLSYNDKASNFVDHWLSLHPEDIIKLLVG